MNKAFLYEIIIYRWQCPICGKLQEIIPTYEEEYYCIKCGEKSKLTLFPIRTQDK